MTNVPNGKSDRPPPKSSVAPWTRISRAITLAFFCSGASALIYQVVWLRKLSTIFGNTTLAISITLTAFMAGLAIGSYLLGRRADRWERPFGSYAWLEILIGAYGLASLSLLSAVHSAYAALSTRLPYDSVVLLAFHFAACFVVLVVPTALMGGTLPVALKGLVRHLEGVDIQVGKLYGANTFGAALGVVMAGFFLLPVLGLKGTVLLAALINLAVGVLVLRMDQGLSLASSADPGEDSDAPATRPEAVPTAPSPLTRPLVITLVVTFALSGFAGLALEVVWARALALYMGSSVYTFSAVLLAVLIGIALGSLLVAKLAARRRMTPGWLAGVLLAAGASTLMMVFGYNLFPVLVAHLITRFGTTYPLLLTLEVLAVSGFMLLPTLFSGATFPILSRVYVSREGTVSRQIGYLYAMNTVGCILGAFLSGFVLIPLLGLRATVMLCGSLYVLGGTAILLMAGGRPRLVAAVTVPALAVALLLLPTWRTALMSRALFRPSYPDATRLLALAEQGIDIAFYRDGAVATVAVVQGKPPAVYHPENESAEGTRALVVNGKGDASDSVGDMDTQRLVGHLPLLMAPRLDSVLVVGMGSGTTCGAVGLYPVRKIDCVEIEPVVVDASEYFLHVNRNILQDPRFHLIVADARNYLIAGQQKYDVIINEPSNPWVAGVASLFTVENFQALRDHLADDGVICQWLQLYEMSPSDVACVVATFTKVFPDATLWWATREYSDVVLVARKQPWKVDLAQMRQRAQLNPEIAADLARTRFQSPDEVLSYLMLGAADLRRLGATGALNTDDWPYLEFSAPRSLYGDPRQNGVDVLALLTAHRTLPLDEIVAFGPQARDAGTIEALGDSFRRLHTPSIRALFYLGWMRDLFTKAATLAPERHTASEKLKQVEAEASRLRRAAPVDRQR